MAILAIDQGGSKTIAILGDESGNVLSTGTSFGACHYNNGLETALEAIDIAVNEALKAISFDYSDINSISAGLAGANWPDEIELLEKTLKEHFDVADVSVYNDVIIALRGGSDNPNAIALCGGTGLNCALTTDSGFVKVYNNYIDDLDQGGGSLGARALLAVFKSEIGILPKTVLREKALQFFEFDNVDDLLLSYQRGLLTKPLKEVSFILFEAANEEDEVALGVIYDFGVSLSKYVIAGAKKYDLVGKEFDVVLSGGVFKANNPLLQDTICAHVHRLTAKAKIINAEFEPVVGALIIGLEKIHGKNTEKNIYNNCHKTAKEKKLTRIVDLSQKTI